MKLQSVAVVACLLSEGLALPIFQRQFGILASNSNELVGFNGLTLPGVGFGRAQVSPFLPAFGIQPDLGLPAQLVPLNPQLAGPFLHHVPSVLLPAQGNQLPPGVFPPSQQEQPVSPQDPSMPSRQQIPNQVVPQYYPSIPFPQRPGGQWFSYYFPYGSPQRSPTVAQQQLNQGQQNLEQITQTPILLLQGNSRQADGVTAPPSRRGDTVGTEEVRPNFSFAFEP